MIRQHALAASRAMERLCEQALTDPSGRGILVRRSLWDGETAELSADVPYGTIEVRPVV